MKVFYFYLVVAFFLALGCASSKTKKKNQTNIDSTLFKNDEIELSFVLDSVAEFPGGKDSLGKFLAKNIRYPFEAQLQGISGRVIVSFVILKTGDLTNILMANGINKYLQKETIRIIELMPKWKPAYYQGEPVNTSMSLPINFQNIIIIN